MPLKFGFEQLSIDSLDKTFCRYLAFCYLALLLVFGVAFCGRYCVYTIPIVVPTVRVGWLVNTYLVTRPGVITSLIGRVRATISVPMAIGRHVNVSSFSDCRFVTSFIRAITTTNYAHFVIRTHAT